MCSYRQQQRHHSAPGRQSTLLLVGLHQNDLSDWKFASTEVLKIIPVRTCCNFFRLSSAFLEGEIADPSLKKLREVRTQLLLEVQLFSKFYFLPSN